MARRGSSRDRREQRRAQAAKPVQTAQPTPRNRGTFHVAKANAALREALPDVVFQRKPRPVAEEPRKRLSYAAAEPQAPAKRSKPIQQPGRNTPQLSMEKPKNCKPRPSTSKGNGTGRPFVPHCNR